MNLRLTGFDFSVAIAECDAQSLQVRREMEMRQFFMSWLDVTYPTNPHGHVRRAMLLTYEEHVR